MASVELRERYEERMLDLAWLEYQRLEAAGTATPADHFYGALTARLNSDLFKARLALEKGLQAQPEGAVLGQLRLTLGAVLREIGEYRGAIEAFEAFLVDLPQYPELEPVAAGHAYYNLGLAFRQAKEPDRAIASYERAAVECRRNDMPELLRTTLQNLAWASCMAGNAGRAAAALDEAEPLCRGGEAWAHQKVGRAFLESVAGDPRQALDLCQQLLQDRTVSEEVRSQACWVAGRVSLSGGQVEAAESLARQAQTWAAELRGDSRCLRDAAELLRQVMMIKLQQTGA